MGVQKLITDGLAALPVRIPGYWRTQTLKSYTMLMQSEGGVDVVYSKLAGILMVSAELRLLRIYTINVSIAQPAMPGLQGEWH